MSGSGLGHNRRVAWLTRGRGVEYSDILVVCTGNVCRSPYIAAMLRSALPGVVIASAGTDAAAGELPGELIRRGLAAEGIEAIGFVPARQVSHSIVRGARLIITATTAQRLHVAAFDPSATSRTFTLKELARVVGPNERGIDEVVARAATAAHVVADQDYDDDLRDPFGLGRPAYLRMALEVNIALAKLVPALTEGAHD